MSGVDPRAHERLLTGRHLHRFTAGVDTWATALERCRSSLCLVLDHATFFDRGYRRSVLGMHRTVGSLMVEAHLLLDVLEDQIVEPAPLDDLLERLYHRFGERWAVGTPEPSRPGPPCEHPGQQRDGWGRADLVATTSVTRRLEHDTLKVESASRMLLRTPSTELFPEFRAGSESLADELALHRRAHARLRREIERELRRAA